MGDTLTKDWEYGNTMLEQGNIDSLEEWSDDKEYCCSIMDEEMDYLWDFSRGIHFIDKLYSEYRQNPNMYNEYTMDKVMVERMDRKEADMWFNSFDEVRQFIDKKRSLTVA